LEVIVSIFRIILAIFPLFPKIESQYDRTLKHNKLISDYLKNA
jgi:hypothetical protein